MKCSRRPSNYSVILNHDITQKKVKQYIVWLIQEWQDLCKYFNVTFLSVMSLCLLSHGALNCGCVLAMMPPDMSVVVWQLHTLTPLPHFQTIANPQDEFGARSEGEVCRGPGAQQVTSLDVNLEYQTWSTKPRVPNLEYQT